MESIIDTSSNSNILKNNDTNEESNNIPDNNNKFKYLSEKEISNKLDDILNETIDSFNNDEFKKLSTIEVSDKLDNILNETIKNVKITDKDTQTLDFNAFLNLMQSLPIGNMFGNLNNKESETSCKTPIDENDLDTETESDSDLGEYEINDTNDTNDTKENLNNIFDPSKLFGDNANKLFDNSFLSNIIEKMSNKDALDEKNKSEIMDKMKKELENVKNIFQNLGMGDLSNIMNSVNDNSELDELQQFLINEEDNNSENNNENENSENENSENENSDDESYDQTDDETSSETDNNNFENKNDDENNNNFLNQFSKIFNLNFLTKFSAKSEKNNDTGCENDNASTDSDVNYDERINPSPKTESDDGTTVSNTKDKIETSNEQLNDIINKNTKMFDEVTAIMNKLGLNLQNMPEIKNKIKKND